MGECELVYLKTFDDMKKTSVFFMLKPVNAIYGFIITVTLSLVCILIWSFFAPMDDVVKAEVLLRPGKTVSVVRCVTSGELLNKAFRNDDSVIQGELLFSLDTTTFEMELESYRLKKEKNDEDYFVYQILFKTIQTGRIDNVQKNSEAYLKSNTYLLEKSRYETVLEDTKNKYLREKDAPEGLRILQNIIDSENQYLQTKLSYESWLNTQKIQVNQMLSSLESEKKNIQVQISELERTIKNSKIYAPISGRISESTRLNPGDYIMAGEEILRIVPDTDESLKADLYVDPAYIARVNKGDEVKIKFPGLAPSRYGMIETEVSLVPPDVTLTKTGDPVFIVEAEIKSPYLYTKHGEQARLLPGITAEARIITEKSTVFLMMLRKLDFN